MTRSRENLEGEARHHSAFSNGTESQPRGDLHSPDAFVPILDFIHALSYVFAAATAGRKFADGWQCYMQWIDWVWRGDVARVIAALTQRQRELGTPTGEEATTSPRQVVARALVYLQNHQDQMRYAEYRRLGLPITSSYVESAVKPFNQRVKGTGSSGRRRAPKPSYNCVPTT
jgi:hypothetical protein